MSDYGIVASASDELKSNVEIKNIIDHGMKNFSNKNTLQWLIDNYFSSPEKTIQLKKGDRLFKKGDENDRLYLVKKGHLIGYVNNPDGSRYARFDATKNMFVGVVSFFSRTYVARANVIAEKDSEIAFITKDEPLIPREGYHSLFDQFMPVVVTDLAFRQQREQEIFLEKEAATKKLAHTEKMASLGQMAAGLAHELNNAIAVIERNTNWLRENITLILKLRYPQEYTFFQYGNEKGRRLSSSEVRKRTREISKKFALAREDSHKLAQTGISEKDLHRFVEILEVEADIVHYYWDIGATFYDMAVAARHAAHVVRSVKALGAQRHQRQLNLDVNNSIKEALALLGAKLDAVKLKLDLRSLPLMTGSIGELVQIWTNLIKNAIESMQQAEIKNAEVRLRSQYKSGKIIVEIEDNGPGIPDELQSIIFQPNVTTKAQGLSFGLGLGLSIIEKIVDSYNGTISVRSVPGKTVFKVEFPTGESDE